MASLNTHKLYSLATMQAYLDGSLDQQTTEAVEKLLAQSTDYAEAMEGLDRFQSDSLSQRETEQKSYKEYLSGLGNAQKDEEGTFEEPLVRDLRSARWWQIAAVILILALPLFYLFQKPKATINQLAMAQLEPYTFSGLRSGEGTQSMLDSAQQIYEAGRSRYEQSSTPLTEAPVEFESAKDAFLKVLSQPKDSLGTQQYLEAKMGMGMCLLFQGYQDQALEQFEVVIQQGDNIYLPAANWYKAWSLLLLDRKDEAISVLSALSRRKSDYRDKAQGLLDEL